MTAALGGDGRRVLIIDDNDDWRFLARRALAAGGGWSVVGEVDTLAVALRLARSTEPDVVLIDVGRAWADVEAAIPFLHEAAPSAQIVVWRLMSNVEQAADADLSDVTVLDKNAGISRLVPFLTEVVAAERHHTD